MDFNDQFTSPSILSMMGDYYLSEHRDSLSLACYDEALRTQSDYVPAILGKSEVYRLGRRYPEYFATLDEFIENENVPVQAKGMYVGNVVRSLDLQYMDYLFLIFRGRTSGPLRSPSAAAGWSGWSAAGCR